jgi:tricorn protease
MLRLCFLPLVAWLVAPLDAAPGYFRSPEIHGDTVVFTAEGDLWKVPATGGAARRLTTHPGEENSARISRDGRWIAFAARYEGPEEVYVMPAAGGLPKRLTWLGESASPVAWTADGKVLCATRAHSTLPDTQLVAIDPTDGGETRIPLAQAAEGVQDDEGKRLVFTRLRPQSSSTKRYRGGTAQNLWRFDEGTQEAVPLTADYPGTSMNPMWWRGRVYFLSDRDGIMNLWSMTPEGKELLALTKHPDFDIRDASQHDGRIVYQQAGSLRLFTLSDSSDIPIPITLESDLDQTRVRRIDKPFDYLTKFSLSPDGGKLALTARGSVFVAPVKPGGRLVEIPKPAGVRYREAGFLPDGESLAAQTDETGEIEMVKLPANGIGAPELLTGGGTVFRFAPVPSPDGKRLAWQDKNLDLWVQELDTRRTSKVSTALVRGFRDLAWSPDGQWLAFVEPSPNTFLRIRLYHVADGTIVDATGERVNSFSPAWSADGKWLYFLSDRELKSLVKSPWGLRQPEPYFTESTRIYALGLQAGQRFPFQAPDELNPEPKREKPDKKDDPAKAPAVVIEPDGLAARLFEVPGVSGNLSRLVATPKYLFFESHAPGTTTKARVLRMKISDEEAKTETFASDFSGWSLSLDGSKVALRKQAEFFVVPADGNAPAALEKPVPLGNWNCFIDPREEWRQIYRESWRMLRDYFYDPAMHGVDWVAVREKYAPLVDRVADRADLSQVLQEMAGELMALHINVRYGDLREGPDRIEPSSLGARLSRDAASGGWRIDHIFKADPDYPDELSPLARPGVEVKEGSIVLAIDGRELGSTDSPWRLLSGKAGQQVLLDMLAPDGARRKVIVRPLAPEAAVNLRFSEWQYTRRLEVEQLSENQIGYLHLRNMGPDSIIEWARGFYPVFNRQGLIIDVRHNQGGNTDSWILGRLLRKRWFHWAPRAGMPYSNMQYAFDGHLVVLCNEWTSSDGEAFCEGVKRMGLGRVIGTRTWGGQIWLDAQRWLIDNGMCTAAENGVYGPEGDWLIEGVGVLPDQVVDNPPHETFLGKDAQLEAAVRHLQERIRQDPRPLPQIPPRPDKSK